jgi:type VI secretion system secreted protein Hcp
MEYKMSDVIVRSVRPGGNSKGPDQVPHEEVSFAYGKIAWTYTETDHSTGKPKGDVKGQWSCITNSGS